MAETDRDQKTEQPTEKHISDAIDRGQFARSPEITLAFVLTALLGVVSLTISSATTDIATFAVNTFSRIASIDLSIDTAAAALNGALLLSGRVLLPLLIACAGAALLAGGIQSGFQLTPKAFGVHWERLNIISGFERLFTKSTIAHLGIDVLKLLAVVGALYGGVKTIVNDPLFHSPVDASYLGQFLHHATMALLGRMLLALGVIAAISYTYEIFRTRHELMMTRQEVRDERKNNEGDAHVKSAQRRLARRLMQRQMLAAVATADVVITNPTHYAVALKYERGVDIAPVVLAKGENRFALRIRAIATENEVPIVENPPVARLLYAVGRVGEAIPGDLYKAVAQILAFVYRTHRYYFYRLKARRAEAARA